MNLKVIYKAATELRRLYLEKICQILGERVEKYTMKRERERKTDINEEINMYSTQGVMVSEMVFSDTSCTNN